MAGVSKKMVTRAARGPCPGQRSARMVHSSLRELGRVGRHHQALGTDLLGPGQGDVDQAAAGHPAPWLAAPQTAARPAGQDRAHQGGPHHSSRAMGCWSPAGSSTRRAW